MLRGRFVGGVVKSGMSVGREPLGKSYKVVQ